jgi:hypothetical protein
VPWVGYRLHLIARCLILDPEQIRFRGKQFVAPIHPRDLAPGLFSGRSRRRAGGAGSAASEAGFSAGRAPGSRGYLRPISIRSHFRRHGPSGLSGRSKAGPRSGMSLSAIAAQSLHEFSADRDRLLIGLPASNDGEAAGLIG